jgi:hypothetical protein
MEGKAVLDPANPYAFDLESGGIMRRTIVEWLSMLAVGLFVTTVALLAASFHPHWPAEPLGFNLERWGMGSAYVQVRGGTASLFNQIDFESPGSPKPSIVNPRAWIWPSVTGNHQFAIPGLAFQLCRFSTGLAVWSVSFSLAIPAALSLIAAVFLIRRLRRRRPKDTPVRVETA